MLGIKKTVSATALMAVAGVLSANPAWAQAAPALLEWGVGSDATGTHNVLGTCGAVTGQATNFNEITYVVRASADAFATNLSVGIGTTVRCKIVEKNDNIAPRKEYGEVAGGLPGPHAEAVGTVKIVTVNTNPGVCIRATAGFSDGGSATWTLPAAHCSGVSW